MITRWKADEKGRESPGSFLILALKAKGKNYCFTGIVLGISLAY